MQPQSQRWVRGSRVMSAGKRGSRLRQDRDTRKWEGWLQGRGDRRMSVFLSMGRGLSQSYASVSSFSRHLSGSIIYFLCPHSPLTSCGLLISVYSWHVLFQNVCY